MGKLFRAEYDAEHNALRLVEPLEGVKDHEEIAVFVSKHYDPERPWLAFSGILSKEAGDELSQIVNEMFPPWND